jgi:16S rRNA (guanine966-N2)-methyltransferase
VRIISGSLKGKRLAPVPGKRVRPSSDRLRESVFNILGPTVVEAKVLDLFAGTGSFGIEALSRGALSAVFIDNHPQSVKILNRNITDCFLKTRSTVYKKDILRGLKFLEKSRHGFDLVFLDPPYDLGMIKPTLRFLDQSVSILEEGLIVVEHSARESFPETGSRIQRTDKRRYGKALVSFYETVL